MTAPASSHAAPRGAVGLLRFLVVVIALGPMIFTANPSSVVPDGVRLQSGLLWIMCWLPAFVYLMRSPARRPPFPFLAIIGVANGMYYALQLTLGVDNANHVQMLIFAPLDPRHDYQSPIALALLGWVVLLVGYALAKQFIPPRALRIGQSIPVFALRTWGLRLLVAGIAFEVLRQAAEIPTVLRGLLNFAVMLGQFGMAILIVLNVRGHLERRHRIVLFAGFATLILLAIGTGSIASGVFVTLIAVLALWIGGQRVRPLWVGASVVAAVIFVALRGVAMDYREIAWFTDEELPVAQRSQVLLGILGQRIDREGVGGAVLHGWEVVSTRSANLDLFADVVRRTPHDVPYWHGQTYLSLVGIAVPRVLWPNKPVKELGQAFGHRYNYLGDWDRSTSVNLPYFIEFYCNFGPLGVILGMLLVGILYAALEQRLNAPRQSALASVCAVVLLTPLVNIESDFSLIFGGLLLNGVALWGVLKYIEQWSRARVKRSVAAPAWTGIGAGAVRR